MPPASEHHDHRASDNAEDVADIVVIGAGAAGLFAAIHAARAAPGRRVVALDGARTLGAKILVAGGGRCNVTHHAVSETDYHGSTRPAIRNVLRRFDVPETVEFFRMLGVELKREETGKLFPVTDSARTVLAALLREAERVGVRLDHPRRVTAIERKGEGWAVMTSSGTVRARQVVLAAGGQSLPKSGSDGAGFELARSAGLRVTPRLFPGLVPLRLTDGHWLRGLSGVAFGADLRVRAGTGKVLAQTSGAVLCAHFGISGPGVLDISRELLAARYDDDGAALTIAALPGVTTEACDAALAGLGKCTPLVYLKDAGVPERLALALCAEAGADPHAAGSGLRRDDRRSLVRRLTDLHVPVTGPRGWNYAEVTAGGVPLSELHLKTLESRAAPGLHLCGEVCDVDGRIGGFNFQWAWASGFVAGTAAAQSLSAGG